MDFFKKLNFSSSNEDGASEIAALTGATRILCITGSGTRPLDLLQTNANEVIAFDVNPAQNALLALKLAAIEALDHAQYLAFLGITDGARLDMYRTIKPLLSPEMQGYWDQRSKMIAKGIWHAGKWEKLLYWNASFLAIFRKRDLEALLQAPDIESQAQIWSDRFDGTFLRRTIQLLGRDWVWRRVIREPGGEFLPQPKEVSDRLAHSFKSAAGRFLFRDSDFATLIFRGALRADSALPVHMRAQNYARTKDRLGRIRIVEGNLTTIKAAGVSGVDGFSVSDFGSYTNEQIYAACWQGIIDAATDGATFCERIFMNELPLPFDGLQEDMELSQTLTNNDMAIIYRLRVGKIAKG